MAKLTGSPQDSPSCAFGEAAVSNLELRTLLAHGRSGMLQKSQDGADALLSS
jgi:hypothetical protein